MPMSQEDAANQADFLLGKLIEHQTQLFAPPPANAGAGESVGKAIAALRQQLIEMYRTQP